MKHCLERDNQRCTAPTFSIRRCCYKAQQHALQFSTCARKYFKTINYVVPNESLGQKPALEDSKARINAQHEVSVSPIFHKRSYLLRLSTKLCTTKLTLSNQYKILLHICQERTMFGSIFTKF